MHIVEIRLRSSTDYLFIIGKTRCIKVDYSYAKADSCVLIPRKPETSKFCRKIIKIVVIWELYLI